MPDLARVSKHLYNLTSVNTVQKLEMLRYGSYRETVAVGRCLETVAIEMLRDSSYRDTVAIGRQQETA